MQRVLTLMALLSVGLAAGCGAEDSVYLQDDLDLELQLFEIRPEDELHVPYVQGTEVRIDVGGRSPRASFRLEVADGNVLTILDQINGSAHCLASAPGVTTITLYDGVEKLHEAQIEVAAPNRAELLAHGPILLDRDYDEAVTFNPMLVVGGTDTFLVRYFEDDRQLFGNGVLEPVTTSGLDAVRAESYVFENRDWLRLTAEQEGSHGVSLRAGEATLAILSVEGVSPGAITRVNLVDEEAGADSGAHVAVWARSQTAAGDIVHGVEYDWSVDGIENFEAQGGNVFKYRYEAAAQPQLLYASYDDHGAVIPIHGADFSVDSTNNVGCAVSPAAGSGSRTAFLLIGLAGLIAIRRRRPR